MYCSCMFVVMYCIHVRMCACRIKYKQSYFNDYLEIMATIKYL